MPGSAHVGQRGPAVPPGIEGLDLADWSSMSYVGPASDWDEIWWRGRAEDGKFTAWYVKDGRLAAALTVGRPRDLAIARRLLAQGTRIAESRKLIEDPEGDLSGFVG